MSRRRFTAVFAVLAALTLFFGGMLTYKLMADRTVGPGAAVASRGSGQRDGISIEGRVAIEVIRNGRVITTWKGHNALYAYGKNAIAGCLSGSTTAPAYFGSCSGFIKLIELEVTGGGCAGWCERATATSAATPAGCDPTSGFIALNCQGWTTSATVTMSDDETVLMAAATNPVGEWFDTIDVSPNLSVKAGDRVATTITFTVS